jgi:hypothetical protein
VTQIQGKVIPAGQQRPSLEELVTADHHEFDSLEEKGEAKFYWIR